MLMHVSLTASLLVLNPVALVGAALLIYSFALAAAFWAVVAIVAIAVSCPHRGEAFESCQWLIDTLKQVVPIWKRETWADGAEEWIHPGLVL